MLYRIPLLIGLLFRRKVLKYVSKINIKFSSERKIPYYESNVLGGASPINGCVHTLGSKIIWNKIIQRFDSTYESIIESKEKIYSENIKEKNKIIIRNAPQNKIDKIFIKALQSKGVKQKNLEYSDEEGCGPISNTVGKLFRTSVITLNQKPQYSIYLDECVEKINIETNGIANGVKTTKRYIPADYIILTAGVIGTCKLLLNQKESCPNTMIFDALAIGQGIKDHTNLRINVVTNENIGSLNEVSNSLMKKAALFFRHIMGVPTLMMGTGATSGVQLDLDGDGILDIRIHVVQFTETGRHGSDGKYFSSEPGFSLSITPINPISAGYLSITNDIVDINPMYLMESIDKAMLKKSLNYCMHLLKADEFKEIVKEISCESQIINDPESYINENIFSGHHLIGGCHAAIDENFKIKTTENLYVCDASLLNEYPASNIHSSVVLMADIFSGKFLKENK